MTDKLKEKTLNVGLEIAKEVIERHVLFTKTFNDLLDIFILSKILPDEQKKKLLDFKNTINETVEDTVKYKNMIKQIEKLLTK